MSDTQDGARLGVAYTRISVAADGSTEKVETQLRRLRAWADANNVRIVDVYTDNDRSALEAGNRPDLDRLLADMRPGRWDVLLATEESRLARNTIEKQALIMACAAAGMTWHTLSGGTVDPATAEGEFLGGLRAVLDRRESRVKAERQRASNLNRATVRGLPVPGRRLYGYLGADRATGRIGNTVPDPDESPIVRAIFEAVASGASIRSIAADLNARGIDMSTGNRTARAKRGLTGPIPWRPMQIRDMIRNRTYVGEVPHRGAWYPSERITPLVPADVAELARAIIDDPTRRLTPGPQRRYLLASLAHCAICNSPIRALKAGANRRPAYLCRTTKHVYIDAAATDAIVSRRLAEIIVRDRDDLLAEITTSTGSSLPALIAELQRIDERQAEALALRDDGLLSPTALRQRLADLRTERDDLEQQIDAIHSSKSAAAILLSLATDLLAGLPPLDGSATTSARTRRNVMRALVPEDVSERFEAMDLERQREAIAAFVTVDLLPYRDDSGSPRTLEQRVKVARRKH